MSQHSRTAFESKSPAPPEHCDSEKGWATSEFWAVSGSAECVNGV